MMNSVIDKFSFAAVIYLVALVPIFGNAQTISMDLGKPSRETLKLSQEQLRDLKIATNQELKEKYKLKTPDYSPIKAAFRLKTPKPEEKILRSGGGVVDGGGGNLTANGDEILDQYQYGDLQKLDPQDLRSLLYKFYSPRIEAIEQETPGFRAWLENGFTKQWFLDPKPFNKAQCSSEKLGTCQTDDAVYFKLERYQTKTDAEKASTILGELLRNHTAELSAKMKEPATLDLQKKIQDPQFSGQRIYSTLVKATLLYSPEVTEQTRAEYVAQYDKNLKEILTSFEKLISACQQAPMNFSKSFYKAADKYASYVKMCADWLDPQKDLGACSIEPLADAIVEYRNSCK